MDKIEELLTRAVAIIQGLLTDVTKCVSTKVLKSPATP